MVRGDSYKFAPGESNTRTYDPFHVTIPCVGETDMEAVGASKSKTREDVNEPDGDHEGSSRPRGRGRGTGRGKGMGRGRGKGRGKHVE